MQENFKFLKKELEHATSPSNPSCGAILSAAVSQLHSIPWSVRATQKMEPSQLLSRMSGKIFISYRREDDPGLAGRLFDALEKEFGREQLFLDVDSIELGLDFLEVISKRVAESDVLLAVIGKGWLNSKDENGNRRLDNELDFVRFEIETALQLNKRVIPVIVGETSVPKPEQLPEKLRPLPRRNAFRIRHDRFRSDVDDLVDSLRRVLSTYPGGTLPVSRIEKTRNAAVAPERAEFLWKPALASILFMAALTGSVAFFTYGRPGQIICKINSFEFCIEQGWMYVGTLVENRWETTPAENTEPAVTIDTRDVPILGRSYRVISPVNLCIAPPLPRSDGSAPQMQESTGTLPVGKTVFIQEIEKLQLTMPTVRTWVWARVSFEKYE